MGCWKHQRAIWLLRNYLRRRFSRRPLSDFLGRHGRHLVRLRGRIRLDPDRRGRSRTELEFHAGFAVAQQRDRGAHTEHARHDQPDVQAKRNQEEGDKTHLFGPFLGIIVSKLNLPDPRLLHADQGLQDLFIG